MARIEFPYPGIEGVDIPDGNLIAILEPRVAPRAEEDDASEVRRALSSPIGTPRLRDMAPHGGSVLILIDDNTRNTPADSSGCSENNAARMAVHSTTEEISRRAKFFA